MAAEPFSWNVVIAGSWNLAILTPAGVAKRLLALPQDSALEVEVAIDKPGSFRVRHEGLIVVPLPAALEVATTVHSITELVKAVTVSKTALHALPETPVTAAGVNFRFRYDVLPSVLSNRLSSGFDDPISDLGFEVQAKRVRLRLAEVPGVVNLEVDHDLRDGSGTVLMNFHRDSQRPQELADWIGRVEEFHEKATALLSSIEGATTSPEAVSP